MNHLLDGFQGQTILITGASSGIGRSTAIHLATQGARVLLCGRNQEALGVTARQIPDELVVLVPHDLQDLNDACLWVTELSKRWGPLDSIVHAAGNRHVIPIRMLKQTILEEELRIHVQVPIGLIKGFRQRRPKGLGGSVVLVSSVMGLVGAASQTSYGAVKSAMIGMVRSAALELASEGIRLNAVAPGCVQTEMMDAFRSTLTDEQYNDLVAQHPLGLGTPEDVAYAISFLLGKSSRWITGTTLIVDGGYTAR